MLENAIKSLETLTTQELEHLSAHIYTLLSSTKEQSGEEIVDTIACPVCGSVHCVRNGKVNNKQRFLCVDCKRSFGFNTGRALAHTKLPRHKWERYISCMLEGYSIRKSADIVGVGVKTSFYMRHKILDALQPIVDSVGVSGIVEADETFLPESFKGNHKKSGFKMPRKARKRGKQVTKNGLSSEQICIATAIDRSGNVVMKTACHARASYLAIMTTFRERVREGAVFCTDKLAAYNDLAKRMKLVHKRIKSNEFVSGVFSLARVNSLHSRFKKWIRRFCGVSTKHLGNYLTWFSWLEKNKGARYDAQIGTMWRDALANRVDARVAQIRSRQAVLIDD